MSDNSNPRASEPGMDEMPTSGASENGKYKQKNSFKCFWRVNFYSFIFDSLDVDICRVCRCEGTSERPLFYPCVCTGSIKYIHQDW